MGPQPAPPPPFRGNLGIGAETGGSSAPNVFFTVMRAANSGEQVHEKESEFKHAKHHAEVHFITVDKQDNQIVICAVMTLAQCNIWRA